MGKNRVLTYTDHIRWINFLNIASRLIRRKMVTTFNHVHTRSIYCCKGPFTLRDSARLTPEKLAFSVQTEAVWTIETGATLLEAVFNLSLDLRGMRAAVSLWLPFE